MFPDPRHRVSLRQRAETAEERLDLFVQNVRDYAIFIISPAGTFESWNAGVRRVLGYEEIDFLGRPFAILFPAEDLPERAAEAELAIATACGRAEDERWHVRRDGTRFWASGILSALRDRSGQLRGFAKIMRDITERKLAEQEREQLLQREKRAREDAELATRMRDQFLAMLSHELRTPLNSILGWASILQAPGMNARMLDRGLAAIARGARQQSRLIADLLELPELLTGRVQLDLEHVDLTTLTREAIDSLVPVTMTRSIAVDLDTGPAPPIVRGDRRRLQQVILALVGNAIKFTAPDGRIVVRASRDEAYLVLSVSDNGAGIGTDFLSHVFEPFRSEDVTTRRAASGLGLGLAIVRQIVSLHGGTVAAHSDGPGQGATFTVRLPTIVDPNDINRAETPRASVSLSGLRVLVVDDDDASREMTATALELAGATVISARSAPAGLDAIASSPPDVIVCDLQMPDQDGYDFIKALRSSHDGSTPAIALTALVRPDDRLRALTAGFQIHLGKPVDMEELIGTIRDLAGGSKSL
jgi:PAS domain S-box-containing protein